MRLIDADALKETIFEKTDSLEDLWDTAGILNAINNAPTVPHVTVFAENASKEEIEDFKQELENVLERPQGDIRWTDKLSIKSNGDIIDFEGRVVGHIDLKAMKGGAE